MRFLCRPATFVGPVADAVSDAFFEDQSKFFPVVHEGVDDVPDESPVCSYAPVVAVVAFFSEDGCDFPGRLFRVGEQEVDGPALH